MEASDFITPVATVLVSLVGIFFSVNWLNRRNIAKLTSAQAGKEVASTTEITDKIARQWIVDLRAQVEELEKEKERRNDLFWTAIQYIKNILHWIKVRFPEDEVTVPRIPEKIAQYIER